MDAGPALTANSSTSLRFNITALPEIINTQLRHRRLIRRHGWQRAENALRAEDDRGQLALPSAMAMVALLAVGGVSDRLLRRGVPSGLVRGVFGGLCFVLLVDPERDAPKALVVTPN